MPTGSSSTARALWPDHFGYGAGGGEGEEPARNLKLVPSEESARGQSTLFLEEKQHWLQGLPAWVINTCSNRTQGSCDQTFLDNETLLGGWVPLTETLSCLLPTAPEQQNPLTNGEPPQPSSAPQKSLPDLPPPKMVSVGLGPLISLM